MNHPRSLSRRFFLASVGAASAPRLLRAGTAQPTPSPAPPSPGAMRGLAQADDYLFTPGLVYLQTGSIGPSPKPVIDRTLSAWRELEQDPVKYTYQIDEKAMDDVRARAARFLGCETDELALTQSTTSGMNAVAQGLGLAAGDRVLTTDQEHPGGTCCWNYLVRKAGVLLDRVVIPPGENDAQAIVERFEKALTPKTKVLSFSHLLSSTGLRMPVAELSALARAHGALAVVDGAQAAGGIAVDVKALGCHVYATSGHKWLLGPKGTGVLYISADAGSRVEPISLQSGRNAYTEAVGVINIPGVLGLSAAIEYIETFGIRRVEAHNQSLQNQLREMLTSVAKLSPVSPPPGPLASPLLTYRLPDQVESRAFVQRLSQEHQVVVKMVPKNWFNGIRFSTHLFNSIGDLERAVSALRAELG